MAAVAYRLDFATDLPSSMRRCAHEQLDEAIALLSCVPRGESSAATNPVAAVHGARKNLKKTRALLRLVRPGLDRDCYQLENGALRDAARMISVARDSDAMLATFDRLAADPAFPPGAAQLRERLVEPVREEVVFAEVIEALRRARERVEGWALERCDEETIARGVAIAYRRGARRLAALGAQPAVADLHEWRKRVKDLWYHHRLLSTAWPPVLWAHADQLHELSELLGDDHDLAVLHQRVGAPLGELIAVRRKDLLGAARALGARCYAERPKAFARRIEALLATALDGV